MGYIYQYPLGRGSATYNQHAKSSPQSFWICPAEPENFASAHTCAKDEQQGAEL